MYAYEYFSSHISWMVCSPSWQRRTDLRWRHGFDRCTFGSWWEKFLNADELKVHARHSNDVLFLSNKGSGDGRGRKGSVSVGIASGRRTLSAGERERGREKRETFVWVKVHPVTYQSPSPRERFAVFFPPLHLFTQIVFASTPHPFQMMPSSCCGGSGEGGRGLRVPNVFSLSAGCQG